MYSDKQIEEHKEWNEKINEIPQIILDGKLGSKENVLVKPFKLELVTKTKSGLIEPKYRVGATEGGRAKSEIDSVVWQSRGLVVKVHPDAEHDFKPGQIVWFRPNFTRNNDLWLLIDRELPVAKPSGYLLLNQNWIQFIEKDPRDDVSKVKHDSSIEARNAEIDMFSEEDNLS